MTRRIKQARKDLGRLEAAKDKGEVEVSSVMAELGESEESLGQKIEALLGDLKYVLVGIPAPPFNSLSPSPSPSPPLLFSSIPPLSPSLLISVSLFPPNTFSFCASRIFQTVSGIFPS